VKVITTSKGTKTINIHVVTITLVWDRNSLTLQQRRRGTTTFTPSSREDPKLLQHHHPTPHKTLSTETFSTLKNISARTHF